MIKTREITTGSWAIVTRYVLCYYDRVVKCAEDCTCVGVGLKPIPLTEFFEDLPSTHKHEGEARKLWR